MTVLPFEIDNQSNFTTLFREEMWRKSTHHAWLRRRACFSLPKILTQIIRIFARISHNFAQIRMYWTQSEWELVKEGLSGTIVVYRNWNGGSKTNRRKFCTFKDNEKTDILTFTTYTSILQFTYVQQILGTYIYCFFDLPYSRTFDKFTFFHSFL
jgi:hypothetical protein